MEFEIDFYKDIKGRILVEEFLSELYKKNKALFTKTRGAIDKLRYKTYHKAPISKYLESGLWELRVKSGNNIVRIFYTFSYGRIIILLHGFIKKSQKTPSREIEIARKILKVIKTN